MTKLSRRKVIAGAIAVPIAAGTPSSAKVRVAGSTPPPDQLVTKAAQWISADKHLTAMQLEWQEHESQLFAKAKRMKISCDRACRSNMPEALAMRELDAKIRETIPQLEASASAISLIPATTIDGAIAKIELGLKVQGPFDWQPGAHELLEDGIRELRELLTGIGAGEFSSFR